MVLQLLLTIQYNKTNTPDKITYPNTKTISKPNFITQNKYTQPNP